MNTENASISSDVSKVYLGVLKSKVSYYCMFLLKDFDSMIKRKYGEENSKNMKFVIDLDFINDFLYLLEDKKKVKFDGIPKSTSKNSIEALYNDMKKNILHEDEEF